MNVTINKQLKFEIENTPPFHYHQINVCYKYNKYLQDLYEENFKILMKEIKDINKGKIFLVHEQENPVLLVFDSSPIDL